MPFADRLTAGEKRKLTLLARDLLRWSQAEGREFPWRAEGAGEYEQIVVEVLLQRTTATAVGKFYRAFFDRFPDWATLAAAEVFDLEVFLKPLGLWRRRAQSLLGLARYAAGNEGAFPARASGHTKIPAVGQYVSNAIMVFQHGKSRPLLDVNMARVIERFVRPRRLADIRFDPWLQEAAHWLTRGKHTRRVNWAVLDFAATVCRARNPRCPTCPVKRRCRSFNMIRPPSG